MVINEHNMLEPTGEPGACSESESTREPRAL